MASTMSILLKGDAHCFKFPLQINDRLAMLITSQKSEQSPYMITLKPWDNIYCNLFTYEYVTYEPLDESEAEKYLGSLVKKSCVSS